MDDPQDDGLLDAFGSQSIVHSDVHQLQTQSADSSGLSAAALDAASSDFMGERALVESSVSGDFLPDVDSASVKQSLVEIPDPPCVEQNSHLDDQGDWQLPCGDPLLQQSDNSSLQAVADIEIPQEQYDHALFEARRAVVASSDLSLPWETGVFASIFGDKPFDIPGPSDALMQPTFPDSLEQWRGPQDAIETSVG